MTSTHPVEQTTPATAVASRPWQNTSLPAAERVELLLAEMSVEEKAAQLGSRWVGNDMHAREQGPDSNEFAGATPTPNVAPLEHVVAPFGAVALSDAARHGLGHLTRVYGSSPLTPAQGAAELVRQQRVVMGSPGWASRPWSTRSA